MKRWTVLAIAAVLGGVPILEMACAAPQWVAQQPQTLETYLQQQDYDGGLAWLAALETGDKRDDLARSLAEAAWQHGYYEIARQSLEYLDTLYIRVQMLESLADAHLAVGQQREAGKVMVQAFELSQQTDEFLPYRWVEPFLKTDQEERVAAILANFAADESPTAGDRFSIASAYFQVGRYEKAFEFARLIPDRALGPDDYPDLKVEFLNSIVDRALAEKRVDFALEVAAAINEKGDRVRALQGIARRLESGGEPDRALAILDRALAVAQTIESIGVTADRHTFWLEPNASLLMSLAEDYAHWGQKQTALSILPRAQQSILSFENQFAFSYPAWHRSESLRELALLYWELGEKETARQTLAIAPPEAQRLEGVEHQIVELLALAQLFFQFDRPRQGEAVLTNARQAAGNLANIPAQITELLKIADIYVKNQQFSQAFSLVQEARQLYETAARPDILLSLQIANLEGQVSKPENLLPRLDELRPQLDTPATLAAAIALYKAIPGQEETVRELISQAVRRIETLERDYDRKQQFQNLAIAATTPNSPSFDLDLVRNITRPEERVQTLIFLAKNDAARDNRTLASERLAQALTVAQTIADEGARHTLLVEEARNLAGWSGEGVPSGWQWRYPLVLKIAQALPKSDRQGAIFLNLANNYLKAGEEETALQILKMFPATEPQQFWQTAAALEKYEIALQVAREIPNRDRQIVVLRQISQMLARSGHPERAIATLSEAKERVDSLANTPRKTRLQNGIDQQLKSFDRSALNRF